MKLQSKYNWFLFILTIFLLENGIGYIYYLFPNETDEQWIFRIQVYTSCLMFINSFLYFFIAFFKRFKPMDNIDKVFALLCGMVTVYSSFRLIFGVIYMSDLWYWGVWFIFFAGLLFLRVKR